MWIYIYIYIYMCVCVCVCVSTLKFSCQYLFIGFTPIKHLPHFYSFCSLFIFPFQPDEFYVKYIKRIKTYIYIYIYLNLFPCTMSHTFGFRIQLPISGPLGTRAGLWLHQETGLCRSQKISAKINLQSWECFYISIQGSFLLEWE